MMMSPSDPVDPAKVIAAKLNGRKQPPPAPLRIVDPGIYQGQVIPERRWIVPDWVPVGYVTGLYGPGGTGKSLLMMQLQTALALGKPWLGMPVVPARSLAVYCEDDDDELVRRQAAINCQLYGCSFTDLSDRANWLPRLGENNHLMVFGRNGTGELTPFFDQLRVAALDLGAEAVVIDTVADAFGGNQNDAGQVRHFVQYGLGRLARAINGSVIACAHPSRAGINSGTYESGSVQWDAAFRSRMYLSAPKKERDDDRDAEPADPDARVLTRAKANYASRDETIELRWHDGVLSAEAETGDSEPRHDAETVFLELLDKMIAEGQTFSHNSRAGNYAPKLFARRPERQGYRVADFDRAMQALLAMHEIKIEGYGPPSHPKQRLVRGEPVPF
jgi:RecA-family ATPase